MTKNSWNRWGGAPVAVAAVVALAGMTSTFVVSAAAGPEGAPAVTFTKDVAPILQRSCQRCHRPGGVAPMPLTTYEEVRPFARAIKLRTGLAGKRGSMPPWFIDREVGIQHFRNNDSLSEKELATIAQWSDAGAPLGNPADMPPPLKFANDKDWQIGTPDVIVRTAEVEVKAIQADTYIPLPNIPLGLTEDRYLAAIQMREVNDLDSTAPEGAKTIGGRFIFHHLVMGGGLPVHEVGRNAEILDPEAGILIKAGSSLQPYSAHLHSPGRVGHAYIEFGLKFHPVGYQPTKKIIGTGPGQIEIDLKANTPNQVIEGMSVLAQNTKLLNFEPHMHASGVRMCLEAVWGGLTETLSCSAYDHAWVRVYTYGENYEPLLPKGTILRMKAYFDTTAANRNVTDNRNWQGMGHRSIDNMAFNIGKAVSLTDAEFQQEMAKRREFLKRTGESTLGCPVCWKTPDTAPATSASNTVPQ